MLGGKNTVTKFKKNWTAGHSVPHQCHQVTAAPTKETFKPGNTKVNVLINKMMQKSDNLGKKTPSPYVLMFPSF